MCDLSVYRAPLLLIRHSVLIQHAVHAFFPEFFRIPVSPNGMKLPAIFVQIFPHITFPPKHKIQIKNPQSDKKIN